MHRILAVLAIVLLVLVGRDLLSDNHRQSVRLLLLLCLGEHFVALLNILRRRSRHSHRIVLLPNLVVVLPVVIIVIHLVSAEELALFWGFPHGDRVMVVRYAGIFTDLGVLQVTLVNLESNSGSEPVILTDRLKLILTCMQDYDWGLRRKRFPVRRPAARGEALEVMLDDLGVGVGRSLGRPWHITYITETRQSRRVVAPVIAARVVLARVI